VGELANEKLEVVVAVAAVVDDDDDDFEYTFVVDDVGLEDVGLEDVEGEDTAEHDQKCRSVVVVEYDDVHCLMKHHEQLDIQLMAVHYDHERESHVLERKLSED
jgi:hypothetical protein